MGDLVNRGPESLECLRFVKGLGERATVVLGNHDLHLVSLAEGVNKTKHRDTLGDVLAAPDRDELMQWLRLQPLMHVEGGFAMVHAGLLPQWPIAQARALAGEVEAQLRGPEYRTLLRGMYGDRPDRWNDALAGMERWRVIINAMTRLRVCDAQGAMALHYKGEPGDARDGLTPWFDVPGRRSADHTIVCGHWSALGRVVRDDLLALDSGCVWGRALSAVRLEDRRVYEVGCPPGAPED